MTIRIDFTKACQALLFHEIELLEEHIEQMQVMTDGLEHGDHLALPWDTGWEVTGKHGGNRFLVLEGGAGCSGYGKCTVRVPLGNELGYWLEIEPTEGEREWVENFFAFRRYRVGAPVVG